MNILWRVSAFCLGTAWLFSALPAMGQGSGPTGWWTDAAGVNHYGDAPVSGGVDPSAAIQGQLMGMAVNGIMKAVLSDQDSSQQAEQQRQREAEQARQEAERREREEAFRREQERLQRIQDAAEMRDFWEGSAQAMEVRLGDVFELPAAGRTSPTAGRPAQPAVAAREAAGNAADKKVLKSIDPFGDFVFHGVPIRPDSSQLVVRHLDPNGVAAQADPAVNQNLQNAPEAKDPSPAGTENP